MCAIEYYTYDDYKHWEGDWELIRGFPVSMAPNPFRIHQLLISMIINEDTVVKPDVYFTCNEDRKYLRG